MTDTKHSATTCAIDRIISGGLNMGWISDAEANNIRAAIAAAAPVGEPVAQRAAVRLHEFTSDRPYTEGQKFFEITVLDRAQCRDGLELYAAPVPAAAPDHSLPTDISALLRRHATGGTNLATNTPNELLLTAAAECERFYGGMMNWKECAQAKDKTIIELRERLAAAAPKAALTDADYQEILRPVLSRYGMQRYLNGNPIELNPSDFLAIIDRAIEAASGPNAALVDALQGLHKVCQLALTGKDAQQHSYFETRSGHFVAATQAMEKAEAALVAAGVEVGK